MLVYVDLVDTWDMCGETSLCKGQTRYWIYGSGDEAEQASGALYHALPAVLCCHIPSWPPAYVLNLDMEGQGHNRYVPINQLYPAKWNSQGI